MNENYEILYAFQQMCEHVQDRLIGKVRNKKNEAHFRNVAQKRHKKNKNKKTHRK